MDANAQSAKVAKWRANRFRERVSLLVGLAIFGVAGYLGSYPKWVLTQAIAVCIALFFCGLTVFFHDRTSRCPVCNKRFADSEEYGFGDSPGLALADMVARYPFCNVELDGDKWAEFPPDETKEANDGS